MIDKIIKRDGRTVEFNRDKIYDAVSKAFKETGDLSDEDCKIIDNICDEISNINRVKMTAEEIQDVVEKKLMNSKRKDVAKIYILYRNERTKIREKNSKLTKNISEKLSASNVQNQNANVDERSFGGRIGSATSEVMKDYAMKYCMSEMAVRNHKGNMIYVHDLDHYAVGDHNCISIPFDDLLANGFNTRQTDVRPAQSVNTAFQLLAVIFQLQSLQQFGGVAATHLDWTMVPYVRKSFWKHYKDGAKYIEGVDLSNNITPIDMSIEDEWYKTEHPKAYEYAMDMTVKETYQAVEGMYHNLKLLGRLNSNVKNIAA